MYRYLDEFLRDAKLVVDQEMAAMAAEQPGTPTLLEFSLLIIHCIEVCVLLGKGRWAGWEGWRCVFCWGKGGGLGGRD